MSGYAVTVNGLVSGEELGTTLPHEHLLIDFTCRYTAAPDEADLPPQPALDDRWRLLARPAGYRVNLDGTSIDSAIEEACHFRAAGGRTIVDLTGVGLGPDPAGLKTVADATGLNVIAASGLYVDDALPAWVHEADVDELADRIVAEVVDGGDEGIRRGAIGEIGIEGPTEMELKCVCAAARAQSRTGAPVYLHVMSGILPSTRTSVREVVDLYVHEGGDLSQLVLCHQDGSGDDLDYQRSMLELGLWFAYDTMGFEAVFAFGDSYVQLPTDSRRIEELARLIDAGFSDQLLISQDICYQMMKRSWGGWGYAHILEALPDRFVAAGVDHAMLDRLMVDNPRRLLAFA